MDTADLFQWVAIIRDVPDSAVKAGDRGVVIDHLPSNPSQLEPGYAIEVFQNGETLDVVFVPVSWATPLPQTWGIRESNSTEIRVSS